MSHQTIKTHIQRYYARLFAEDRGVQLPIKTGRELAESLGYPLHLLPLVTDEHWDKFLPCGNVLSLLRPSSGDRLLNLACGAGIDAFALTATHGSTIEVVSLDIVFAVLRYASSAPVCAARHGTKNLHWICGDGEALPLRGESFDWVLINGALNLFPQKTLVLGEIWRVLKPCGVLVGADLCAANALPECFHEQLDAWAWCMSGACSEAELLELFESCGFQPLHIEPRDVQDMLYPVVFSCRKTPPSRSRTASRI